MSDKNSNWQFSFTLTKDRKTTTADTGNIAAPNFRPTVPNTVEKRKEAMTNEKGGRS